VRAKPSVWSRKGTNIEGASFIRKGELVLQVLTDGEQFLICLRPGDAVAQPDRSNPMPERALAGGS